MNFEFVLIFVGVTINLCNGCCTINPFVCKNPFRTNPLDRVVYSDTEGFSSQDIFNLHHAFTFEHMKWRNNTVIYDLDEKFDEIERSRILEGIAEIQNSSCIRFVPYDAGSLDHFSYVRVHKDYVNRDGALSDVGYYNGGQQHVHFGANRINGEADEEYAHTILHEFLHTLGFQHHHMRSDRDLFIRFYEDNMRVDEDLYIKSNYLKLIKPDTTVRFVTQFDLQSVMMYDSRKGSKNGGVTIAARKHGFKVPNHHKNIHGLSMYDKILLNKFYNCKQKKVVVKAP